MKQTDILRTKKLRKSKNLRRYIGIIALILAAVLAFAFVSYMHKCWLRYKLIDPQILYKNPERETDFLLHLAQEFFDKLGISCWAFCAFLVIYGVNRAMGNRGFRFKRYFFRILLVILYGNLLTGFMMPRYRFPYSGALGKIMASWCMENLGVWLTLLLVFLVLPFSVVKLWKQGII